MLCHDTGTPAEDDPGEERTDERVAKSDPGGGDSEVPPELAGITDKDNGLEIGGSVGERGKPGTY